jgi:threonine dehydrogenase-like Zn-dependent dehydrogenase
MLTASIIRMTVEAVSSSETSLPIILRGAAFQEIVTFNCSTVSETGFDIITPHELKMYRAKDPSWGVDLVIDCSGYAPAMEEALTFINPGGTLCIFGVSPPKAKMRCSIII